MPTNVLVPDIGDFKDVEVIDVLVKPGDTVQLESPLITLETDKATIDVPSSAAGVVASVAVKKGDRVSQGSLILTVEADSGSRIADAETTADGERRTADGDEKNPQVGDDKSFTDTLVREP